MKIKRMFFIFEIVQTHVALQKGAACCFVTDVEFRPTHEGKIEAVGVQKQGASKKKNGLNVREKQERIKLSKKGL